MNITLPIAELQQTWAILATRRHSADYPTLRLGKSGAAVEWLRGMLHHVGFPRTYGVLYDEVVAGMVGALQQDEGLTVDRICGRQTWRWLLDHAGAPAPVPVTKPAPWVQRLNTLLDPAVWGQCGYYSSTMDDSVVPHYGITKASKAQRAAAALLGNSAQYGLSCGHLGDYVAKLMLGMDDPRTRRTGMNLGCFWDHRDCVALPRRSTCGLGLFGSAGKKFRVPEKKPWTTSIRGAYRAGVSRADRIDILWPTVVELPTHIIVCLPVAPDSGIIDPRYGLPARPGYYRMAADGGSATPGRPWTFRRWYTGRDDTDARHCWVVVPGEGIEQRAWLNGGAK